MTSLASPSSRQSALHAENIRSCGQRAVLIYPGQSHDEFSLVKTTCPAHVWSFLFYVPTYMNAETVRCRQCMLLLLGHPKCSFNCVSRKLCGMPCKSFKGDSRNSEKAFAGNGTFHCSSLQPCGLASSRIRLDATALHDLFYRIAMYRVTQRPQTYQPAESELH